jgi:hypothetical protein
VAEQIRDLAEIPNLHKISLEPKELPNERGAQLWNWPRDLLPDAFDSGLPVFEN